MEYHNVLQMIPKVARTPQLLRVPSFRCYALPHGTSVFNTCFMYTLFCRSVVDVAIRYHATSVVDVDAIKSKLGKGGHTKKVRGSGGLTLLPPLSGPTTTKH